MKVAVTGSNGLVGKMLLQELKAKGFEVLECNRKNCDILNPAKLNITLKADVVIHCAAQLDEEAKNLFEVNVKGTENVLETCAKNKVQQFIFLSSVGVYGNSKGIKTEKSKPSPETLYEKSKLEAEKKVLDYQEVIPITILRPAIILGNNFYWKKIIANIKKGYPLIGSGKNKWQMVHVKDVVSAIVHCTGNEDCYGEIFNVAEEKGMTLEEIVNTIRKETGIKGDIMKVPVFIGTILAYINSAVKIIPMLTPDYLNRMLRERNYSIDKIRATGWNPKINNKEELKKLAKIM